MKSRFAILAVGLFGIGAAAAQAPIQTRGGGIQGQATNSTWKIGPDGIAHFLAIDPTTVIEGQNLGQIMEKVNTAVASAAASQAAGAPSSRSIASHFGDFLSIKDFGAHLNGSNDDTAAFQAVKEAAVNGQSIMIPPGAGSNNSMNIHGWPASNTDKINFWWLFGKTETNGYPIYSLGYDPVFTTIGNGFWMARDKNKGNDSPLLRLDVNYNTGIGTAGDTVGALAENCNISNIKINNYVWCNTITLTSSASGPGQHVGQAIYAVRPSNALSDNKGTRSEIWSFNTSASDNTGVGARYSGSMVGYELDMSGSGIGGLDYDGEGVGNRIGLQMAFNNTSTNKKPFGSGTGISMGSNSSLVYLNYGLSLSTAVDGAGVTTHGMKPWTTTTPTTSRSNSGDTFLYVDTDNGVEVGQIVSASGIPDNTSISSIDRKYNKITLSNSLTSSINANTNITFTSRPSAFLMDSGQDISFTHDKTHKLLYNGGLMYNVNGLPAFLVDDGLTVSSFARSGYPAFSSTKSMGIESLRMNSGQQVSWENTGAVHTRFSSGELRDAANANDIRTLDMSGNETLSGTVQPQKGVVLPSMTTAQIKAMTNVANATEVYDTDTKTVVLLVDGTWHQIALGDAL